MGKFTKMSNEEILEEILHEAEEFKLRETVLDLTKVLMDNNPKMEKCDAARMALEHAKLHSGLNNKK